jgi:predicted AAA+ superfamily ATPase
MKQIINFLKEEQKIEDKNILYINLEVDFLKYRTIEDLDLFVKKYLKENNISSRIYLFVDEIQELNGWEKLINAYRADDNFDCDIYIT